MAFDGYVQVPVDQTGKKIDTTELTTTVGTVERQRVEIPDEVQVSGNDLSAMLIEQRVQNLLLAQGFGFSDDLDELRNTVSAAALTVAFTQLTDAPSSYTGFAGYNVAVNSTEDGVEFTANSGGITVGTTAIASGTDTNVVYQAAGGLFGEAANFTIISGNPNVTAGNAYLYGGVNAIISISAPSNTSNWFFGNSGNLTASGVQNVGIGEFALTLLGTGSSNMAMGRAALQSLTSGGSNVAIGSNALASLQTHDNNVALGSSALNNNDGDRNIAVGTFAMVSAVGVSDCVAIGYGSSGSLTGNNNTGVGGNALGAGTATSENTAVGQSALITLTNGGGSNTAVGRSSLFNCNSGSNVAVGESSGLNINTGIKNTSLGRLAGVITSGDQNIEIGYNVQAPSATASGQLSIGNYIYGTGLTGTTTTISTAKIGIGVKAPACQLDVDGTVKTKVYTVATLPTAGVQGARALVTDATVTTFATIAAGTGGNIVPVYDDGTNWRIG